MRRQFPAILFLGLVIVILTPFAAVALDRPNYAAVKIGAYFPTGDLDDLDFETGFSGELIFGHYFNPNFAMEGGAGVLESESSRVNTIFGPSFREADIWILPLTVTVKGILSLASGTEAYGGVGIGVYLASFEIETPTALGSAKVDDDDAVIGGHILAGVNVDITPDVYLGIEGKYLFSDEMDFFGADADINGLVISGNIGLRF